jgi:hypothetical protein
MHRDRIYSEAAGVLRFTPQASDTGLDICRQATKSELVHA